MWKVKKSAIHGAGIFATETISKGIKIIEYIGEKVKKSEGDKRSERRIKKYLNSKTTGSVYIFESSHSSVNSITYGSEDSDDLNSVSRLHEIDQVLISAHL